MDSFTIGSTRLIVSTGSTTINPVFIFGELQIGLVNISFTILQLLT
ncbi:uncharacterized protein METZ01_LOCUS113770 [marine metagenome]|uniref:Uncharacterized protein n=1 Tax=marine metagenome TaxID=408172 RepID=A0A381X815_9ZZZZ